MTINNLNEYYNSTCLNFKNNLLFDNEITFSDALALAKSRASFLQKKGYKKGDVIAILAKNSSDWVITYMAITSMGAISLTLDTNLKKADYQKMLDFVGSKAVFVSPEYKSPFKNKKIYDISLNQNISRSAPQKTSIKENDIATLLFTSGTTGNPKVIQLTHSNIIKTTISCIKHLDVRGTDIYLGILPLYHIYGIIANITGILGSGAHIIFQPVLKAPDIIKSLKENKITIFPAVPQLWELFFDGIINKVKAQSKLKYWSFMFFLNSAPLLKIMGLSFLLKKIFKPIHDTFGHSIRFFVSAGAPLKQQYFKYYRNLGYIILNAYGLTETTGPLTSTTLSTAKPISVGEPLAGNYVKIKNMKPDGVGEIWTKGISIMPGYYKSRKANQEAFDKAGWFNTGDLGYIDKQGAIFITGRSKNIIVLASGKNVYPEELEEYYKKSAQIEELAVFGKKINNTETAYAVIVPKNKTQNSYNEIKQEIISRNQGLPSYKIISNFAIAFDPLPRTSKKSLLIREIVKLLEKGVYQTEAGSSKIKQKELSGNTPASEGVINALKIKLSQNKLYGVQTLSDLGIDSLGMIDLIVYLEQKLGITIDTYRFINCVNLEELAAYLATCEKQKKQTLDKEILQGKITTSTFSIYNPIMEAALFLIKIISRALWKLAIINKESININNNIIVANHQSFLDIVWIFSFIPCRLRKNIFLLGKKEVSFLKYIFPGIKTIFVERKGNVVPALKAGADVLRQGKSLMIFPEGTRTKDGGLMDFKTGAAYLSKNLKKEILPITINGAFKIYPRNRLLPEFFTKNKGEIIITNKINPIKFKSIEELNNKIFAVIKSHLKI